MLGLSSISIARKMESPWSAEMTMMPEEDWIGRCKIYKQVSKYLKDHDEKEQGFRSSTTGRSGAFFDFSLTAYPQCLNLPEPQIQPCDVNSELEYGHMVFINGRLNKVLLINAYGQDPCDPCGKGHRHIDFLDTMKTHANLVYCMMAYLGLSNIEWYGPSHTTPKVGVLE